MKLIALFLLFVSLFDSYILYSEYLTKEFIYRTRVLTFPPNDDKTVVLNLIEVFHPFEAFLWRDKNGAIHKSNSVIEMVYNGNITYEMSLTASYSYPTVWVRVVPIRHIVPGGCSWNAKVNVESSTWSTSLSINSAIYIKDNNAILICNQSLTHAVFALPIYPEGNLITSSSGYKAIYRNKEDIVFNAMNQSISLDYLRNKAVLLSNASSGYNFINYTLANRKNRDFIIIVVAYGANNEYAQYAPVYIGGCLSRQDSSSSCLLLQQTYPMYIVLGCAIVFFFCLKNDLLHVLCCGWISVGFISSFIWSLVSKIVFYDNTAIMVIWLGIAPSFSITFMMLFFFLSKKFNKLRMVFTAIFISIVLLSCIWSTPLRESAKNNVPLFASVSGVVAVALIIAFTVCNYLTLTFGGVFVSAVLIGLSVSINNLNSSIIPFFFIDFINAISYSSPNWLYYSPWLTEDLIIVILAPVLSLLIGSVIYRLHIRSLKKEEEDRLNARTLDTYGSIELTPSLSPPLQHIPRPVVQPVIIVAPVLVTSPNTTSSNDTPDYHQNDLPPSYSSVINGSSAVPTAPPQHTYDGPYNNAY